MQSVCKGCYFAPRDLPVSRQTTGRGNIEKNKQEQYTVKLWEVNVRTK